jgi:hypothetical protein
MAQAAPLTTFAEAFRRIRMIWALLLIGTAMYGLKVWQVARQPLPTGEAAPELPDRMRLALGVAAACAGLGSLVALRVFFSPDALARRFERDETRAAPAAMQGHVIAYALAESMAVFGLVLGLIAGSVEAYAPFGVASALVFLLQVPRAQPYVDAFGQSPPDAAAAP